jgi:hypothetical protein
VAIFCEGSFPIFVLLEFSVSLMLDGEGCELLFFAACRYLVGNSEMGSVQFELLVSKQKVLTFEGVECAFVVQYAETYLFDHFLPLDEPCENPVHP